MISSGCNNSPNFDDAPQIEFISFSKTSMSQSDLNQDSVFITLAFQDGDGDIGTGQNGITENFIITDNRTGVPYEFFKIPDIVNMGLGNGIEGEVQMKLFTTCCVFPDGTPPCFAPPQFPTNEISFDIVMIDDSRNRSNVVTTPTIMLLCD